MKLFIKSYKFYSFFFLTFILKATLLLAQDPNSSLYFSPNIYSYQLPQKYNLSPSTSFYKNNAGVIFIGKEKGIVGMYSDKFYYYPTSDPIYISGDRNGNVFYATTNDFGLIYFDEEAGIKINSHKDKIPSLHRLFKPSNIYTLDEAVFISTDEGVITYKNASVDFLFLERSPCKLYKANDKIFLFVKKKGLYIWENDNFEFLTNHKYLAQDFPLSISYQNHLYEILASKGLLTLDKNKEIKAKDASASSGEVHHLINLDEGISIFSNSKNELCIKKSNSKQKILVSNNSEPSVVSLFKDNFNDIWILFQFKLQKFEYPPYISTLNLSQSLNGTILSSLVADSAIYLGTSNSLICLKTSDGYFWEKQTLHKKNDEYFNFINKFNKTIISASNKGLYEIKDNDIDLIDKGSFSFLSFQNERNILCVNKEGLLSYSKADGIWQKALLSDSISSFLSGVIFKKNLTFIDEYQQLWNYKLEKGRLQSLKHPFSSKLIDICKIDSALYILCENSIWKTVDLISFKRINEKNDFSNIQYFELFLKQNILINKELSAQDSNSYQRIHNEEAANSLNIPDQIASSIINVEGNRSDIWLSGSHQITKITIKEKDIPQANTYTLKASLEELSSELNTVKVDDLSSYPHKMNNLKVKILNNRYQQNPGALYRYKLTHYQEDWSDWSQNNSFIADNLWERDYYLSIETLSPSGKVTNDFELYFTIRAPIYRSVLAYIIYSIFLLIIVFLIYKWQLLRLKKVESRVELRIRERTDSILKEKEKSDKLVEDMFPKTTADELKSKGRAKSEKFKKTTVLFSDIQGFTRIAEEMNPEVLIDELDKFFFHFDSVVEKYNIEKIKTIGDAYMAAGGIPIKNSSNPVEVVLAGLEMQHYMKELKKEKADIWDLRIGIHTGPVIAGVVGHKKLSYDIWGDTVNTASRMESSGEIGKVNISGNTYALVKDYFICEYRGKLPVKYKGNIDMYFVKGLRPELSVDLHGIPNKRFFTKVQLLRLQDIEDRLFEHILQDQHLVLHFHTKEFILRVLHQTELLGRAENISEEDKLMVQTAALLLYSGLSDSYENFETKSASIAREILPEYTYDERQIDIVSNLILSTKEPYHPQNKLEAILIDAKMEYLGRADFVTLIKNMFLEQKNSSREGSKERIVRRHIKLLNEFNYFTLAGQRLKEMEAEQQIDNLKLWK